MADDPKTLVSTDWLAAHWLSVGLVAFLTTDANRMFVDLTPDARVLGFAALLALITCVLFGLAPALRATHIAPGAAMKANGRGITAAHERFGLRRVLVVAQMAFSWCWSWARSSSRARCATS
jgi:hypothetical protein